MPAFTPKRFEQILTDEIAAVVTATLLSDVADSSSVKAVLSATARELDEAYFQQENLLSIFDIDKATGDDLDERAAEIQPATIKRVGPRNATGTVIFSRNGTTGTVNISVGTTIKTSDGIEYTTTAVGTITPTSPEQITGHGIGRDSAPVAIVAILPGVAGNVVSGTIVKFGAKPAGVDEVTNLVPTLFGRDKETDDVFRQRLKDFIASLARSTLQALENGVLGAEDPLTGGSILFSKGVEDLVNLGNVTLFIDDGTGSAETTSILGALATPLVAVYTWAGSVTVTTGDTSEVAIGDFIRLDSDGQWFEITGITPSTDVTIANPGSLTIPTGATSSSIDTGADKITAGLAGPPVDTAVGGEVTLFTDNKPVKDSLTVTLHSSTRGLLVQDTDYTLNPASGQLQFTPALVASEVIISEYTYFTGLIALAQKIVDGDPTDRENFPGLRAAGVLVVALTPQTLIQTVTASLVARDPFTQDQAIADATEAVKTYVNGLSISNDVIRNSIISRIESLPSVFDLILTAPSNNIVILDDQLARIQDANITIT